MADDVPQLLLASLVPSTRKQAEQALGTLAVQPGFVNNLLQLVLDQNQDRPVRLAGSVYVKNTIKRRWEEVGSLSMRWCSKTRIDECMCRMSRSFLNKKRPIYAHNSYRR
jgi:hypothetical protein